MASEVSLKGWGLGRADGTTVVTAFNLRARRYTQSIWAGPILVPRDTLQGESLRQVARDIAAMANRNQEPKVAMFLYVMKKELLHAIGATSDMVVVHAFDALGEEHGRSEAAFQWALEIPGAVDGTKVMNLRRVSDMQGRFPLRKPEPRDYFTDSSNSRLAHIGQQKGKTHCYWSAVAIDVLTEDHILRAFEWLDKVLATGGSVKDNAYLLFELKAMVCHFFPISQSISHPGPSRLLTHIRPERRPARTVCLSLAAPQRRTSRPTFRCWLRPRHRDVGGRSGAEAGRAGAHIRGGSRRQDRHRAECT